MSKSQFKHLDQRNQILLRPGQHITGVENVTKDVWLFENDILTEKTVEYNTGLLHIFYEVLSNAQDNYFRSLNGSTPLKKIEITIDKNTISVTNDGNHIPTVIHVWQEGEEKIPGEIYEATLIFGHLNSSGNYDDNKTARMGAGLHGVGVKLTNIFSTYFCVETQDPVHDLHFKQEFYNNMSRSDTPQIKKSKGKGYTKVTYKADFSRFNCQSYDSDFISIVKKLCIDSAMITGAKVIFNGEILPVKGLLEYAKHFYPETKTVEFSSKDSKVVIIENPNKVFKHIAFTNGVINPDGGIHVDEWCKAIFKPLLEKIKKKYVKGKKSNPLKLTQKQLQDHFMIFITCNLANPHFAGQTKARLNSPKPTIVITEAKINSMMKWDFLKDIEDMIDLQSMKDLKKLDAKKTSDVSAEGYTKANKAGKRGSEKCILFVTEGLSAKTIVMKARGIVENGNDYLGALALRGKLLNVQEKTNKVIAENKEIQNLAKVLGLRTGVDYSIPENFKTLRYGKLCTFCDADYDGIHIKGLIKNFLKTLYPSLLATDFLVTLKTPIVKATIGKETFEFYKLDDFKEWSKKNPKFKAKYYKGLGTTTDAEIPDLFLNPKWVKYIKDDKAFESIDLAFSKDKTSSEKRKKWLESYNDEENIVKDYPVEDDHEIVPISDFVNKELILFSIYDCQRSIPNVVDGFKISQRKAIWTALHGLNEKDDYKVSQFAADVAKKSQYHHGEVSMEGTIINLAQKFVGSNNLTILDDRGQFGDIYENGKNHASSRYIFTRLTSIARYIIRKEDDNILKYLEEEGQNIEPKFFVPVIPLILANGCETGIGTGYSTHVPNYNPLDLINWIRNWLEKEQGKDTIPPYDKLIPWYWGFEGKTEVNNKTVSHFGILNETDKNVYEVTELPVKLAVGGSDKCSGFVDKLETLKEKKFIHSYEQISKGYKPQFRIYSNKKLGLKELGLIKTESLNNLTAFGPKGGLFKYNKVEDMLREYCDVRFYYYNKRKKYLLKSLNVDLEEIKSKIRFIKEVLKDVNILKQPESELFEYFEQAEYYKKENSFKYLTDIPVRNFCVDKLESLKKKRDEIKEEINYVEATSPKDMWLKELKELEDAYLKYKSDVEKIRDSAVHAKRGKKSKK